MTDKMDRRALHGTEAPVDETDLDELFRRRRPSPEAFRESIEERIRRLESARLEGGPGSADSVPAHTTRWGRVAAGVPLAWQVGAKAGGLKGLPALLLWPAAVVAAAVGVFAFGARSVRQDSVRQNGVHESSAREGSVQANSAASNARSNDPMRADPGLKRASIIVWVMLFPLIIFAGGGILHDLSIVFLLATMLSVTYGVRRLAASGALVRHEVARVVFLLMGLPLFQLIVQARGLGEMIPTSALGHGPSAACVTVGAIAVNAIAGTGRLWVIALAVAGLFGFLNAGGVTYSSPWGLRWSSSRVELDPDDLTGWEGVAAAHRALHAAGSATPDRSEAARRLREALERGGDVHPAVWTAALEMDLLDSADLERLAEAQKIAPPTVKELERGVRVNPTDYYIFRLYTLARVHQLSPTERTALGDAYLAHWPEPGDHGPLSRARTVVQALDALGDRGRADELRPEVHRLLAEHWVRPSITGYLGRAGGFTSNPEKFRTSFDDSTLNGVELMARFGVPEGIDVRRLRAYLRSESLASPTVFETLPCLDLKTRAALLRLREEIGFPPRTWAQALLDERFFLTILLCTALAVFAVGSAPRQHAGTGALP